MKNLFDENDQSVSEYEMLNSGSPIDDDDYIPPQPKKARQQVVVEEYEEEEEESFSGPSDEDVAYELEDEEQDVVSEAMVRLEQARLYDMLIKHDMFEGVDANPIALANVKAELKQYIIERLQVLLGIRAEKNTYSHTSMRVELPFNRVEIEVLKDLANKVTKGASSQVQENFVAEAATEEETEEPKKLKSISTPPKLNKLKSMGSPKPAPTIQAAAPKKQAQNPLTKQVNPPTKQVTSPPKAVDKKTAVIVNKVKVGTEKLKGKRLVTPQGEEITENDLKIAKEQLERELSIGKETKSPYEMTPEELVERSKKIRGQTKSKKVQGIPMPSPDQVHMMYQQRQTQILSDNEQTTSILARVMQQK